MSKKNIWLCISFLAMAASSVIGGICETKTRKAEEAEMEDRITKNVTEKLAQEDNPEDKK